MRVRKRFGAAVLGLATLTLLASVAAPARADIIFNDFGPGGTYNTSTGYTISGPTSNVGTAFTQGNAFTITPTSDFLLQQVQLAVGLVSGPNEVVVTLRADAGGKPGAVLESFTFNGQMGNFGNFNPPLVADSVLHPLLEAGMPYWLIAEPGDPSTWAAWNLNSIGATGPRAISQAGGPFSVQTDTLATFEITGTPFVPTVPEPSSLALLSLGGLALAGWRRWRKRATA
jgi:hypothetical protein